MLNWFFAGVIVGIISISYLLVSIQGIRYVLNWVFNLHEAEQIVFLKLYKKHFYKDVNGCEFGYNKIKDEEAYNLLHDAIERQYKGLSPRQRHMERQRLQSKLEVIMQAEHPGFWEIAIIIIIPFVTMFILTAQKNMMERALQLISVVYITWMIRSIINDRKLVKQSIQIAFYKICLYILNGL